MKCKCFAGVFCNDGTIFYKDNWYNCEKKHWGYIVTDDNGNAHNFTSARFYAFFEWK